MSRLAPLFANITIDAINLFVSGSSNIVSGLRQRCRAWRRSTSAPRLSALNRWRANPAKYLTPFFSFLKRNILFIYLFLQRKGRSIRQKQRDQPAVLFLTLVWSVCPVWVFPVKRLRSHGCWVGLRVCQSRSQREENQENQLGLQISLLNSLNALIWRHIYQDKVCYFDA